MTDASSSPSATAVEQGLLDRRRQLLGQVARLEDDLAWLQSNVEPETIEEGQEQALANVLERLDEHDRTEIAAIDQALLRIRHGRYGVCDTCGGAIAPARLQALPTTALCLPCAQAREGIVRR